MKNLSIVLIIILAFASCKPAFVRKGLKEVKSERERLLKSHAYIQSLDSAQVRGVNNSYFSKIDSINKYFNDQYSDDAWQLMTEFGQIKGLLKSYVKNVANVNQDHLFSLQQIADLEYDLKGKLISKEQYFIYMKTEREFNDQLVVKSKMLIDNATRGVQNYNILSPRIDSLIIVFKAGL